MPARDRLTRLVGLTFEVQMAMRERFKRSMEGTSFPRMILLRCLFGRSDVSMKELASCLGVAPPSATAMVDSLVTDGLVVRKPDPQDRRGIRLRLTPKGRALMRAGLKKVSGQLTEMFGRLTEEEQGRLIDIFRKLL
jgi:DNA-binding MarR family transcriptional regulator